jgi:hypothetical protein
MRISAGACRCGFARPVQGLWLCAGSPRASPDCHGKKGVAGSSPAEGFRNRTTARFSCFRSAPMTTSDRFLPRRGQASPRIGAAQPFARPASTSSSRPRYRRGTRGAGTVGAACRVRRRRTRVRQRSHRCLHPTRSTAPVLACRSARAWLSYRWANRRSRIAGKSFQSAWSGRSSSQRSMPRVISVNSLWSMP